MKDTKGVRKAVKAMVRELPLTPIVQHALQHAVGQNSPISNFRGNELRHNLTEVVKQAVEGAVAGIVGEGYNGVAYNP